LRELDLRQTKVTDKGLAHLKGLTGLQVLRLGEVLVTEPGQPPLITDAGLAHLKDLTRLRVLSLKETGITGHGLRYLEDMKDLEELDLERTIVRSADLAHLKDLKQLRYLNLLYCDVRDAGLENLKGLENLRHLVITADVGPFEENGQMTFVELVNKAKVRQMLSHIEGLRIDFWSSRAEWEYETHRSWQPMKQVAPNKWESE
jgi:hypothetical protein